MDDKTDKGTDTKRQVSPEEIRISEKQSKREKRLIVVSIVLFFAAVVFLILFLVYFFEAKDKDPDTCSTPECLRSAASISKNLNLTADPCEDFYQFACGRYPENNPLSPTVQSKSPIHNIGYDLNILLRDLLDVEDESAPESIQKARGFYQTCMDTDSIVERGEHPFLEKIKTFGDNVFPTLDGDNWKDENWNLNDILKRTPRYPVSSATVLWYEETNPLFTMSVFTNLKQTDRNIIFIQQAYAPADYRDGFLGKRNSSYLLDYEKEYIGLAVGLGANEAVAQRDARDLVDFEIRVINATLPKEEIKDYQKYYKLMSIQELSTRLPQLDWLQFLQEEFSPVGINLTMEEKVAIHPVEYLDKILPVINETSTRTLLNFCMWKFLSGYENYLPQRIRKRMLKERSKDRSGDVCVPQTVNLFPEVVGRLYVDKHFAESTRTKLREIFGDLKDAFKAILHETDWMSTKTKQAALEKIDAMKSLIGYPNLLKNDTYLNERTRDINISKMAFEDALSIGAVLYKKMLLKLRSPVNEEEWITSPATVNAFAYTLTNSIILPAAFFGKQVFNEHNLDAVTYGGIGYVIGHEITHNFDNTGADFDKDGNLAVWWQQDDLKEFDDRGQCMVDQYGSYSYTFHPSGTTLAINGQKTLGENIADNGGLKEAYKAYQKLVGRMGKEEPRILLNYTPDQLFFISAAQLWCEHTTDHLLAVTLLLDNHSPNRYRVIGPMQNSEEFSRAFSCPEGSYMNPAKKCRVW